jgi:DNA-binding MurR/RpiR family transcriptional regulator
MYTERIQEIYSDLSPGYRRVADYVVNNYRDAAFMTAAEVGRAARVDTTLVVRFAQRLGYPGYPELIGEVQERVKADLRSAYEPAQADNTSASIFQKALSEDATSLEYVRLRTSPEVIDSVVDLLLGARRIFVMGQSISASLAAATVHRLLVMGFSAYVIPNDMMSQAQISVTLRSDDVVVGIGITDQTPSVAVMLRVARSVGAKTVGVAGTLTNMVAREADLVLHTPIRAVGLWPSLTAVWATLSALLQTLTLRQGDRSAEWAARGDAFLHQYAEALRDELPHVREVLAQFNPHTQHDSAL